MRKGHHVKTAWINSPQADLVAAYYQEGHTVTEASIKFGVSRGQVNNLVRRRRITNGRNWQDGRQEANERRRLEAECRIAEQLSMLGFDYVGGYTSTTGNVTIKCRACGDVLERTASFAKNGNLVCKKCEHEKVLARQAERREAQRIESKQLRAERKAAKEAERLKNNPLGLSDYKLRRLAKLDDVSVCKVCGKEYTIREYIESTGIKVIRDSGYCSAKCRDASLKERAKLSIKASHKGRRDSHRHRAAKYGCEYDSSVTLERLIARDGLRCAICGEMCDQNDHSWSEYSGPMYPSIDHIVPMSKGGGHTWSNVQVAHIICNSEKGCKTVEVV